MWVVPTGLSNVSKFHSFLFFITLVLVFLQTLDQTYIAWIAKFGFENSLFCNNFSEKQ